MKNAHRTLAFWAAASALGLSVSCAFAQETYPTKPVRFIAPFPPGGTTDVLSRILAQKLTDSRGRSMAQATDSVPIAPLPKRIRTCAVSSIGAMAWNMLVAVKAATSVTSPSR